MVGDLYYNFSSDPVGVGLLDEHGERAANVGVATVWPESADNPLVALYSKASIDGDALVVNWAH